MSHVSREIVSQPECWDRAQKLALAGRRGVPEKGEQVAVVGCGTSWFMASAYANLREAAGHGRTDAFAASEMHRRAGYDRVLVISRSGTTTEVLALLDKLSGSVATSALTGDGATPIVHAADETIVLDFADEQSVVQTRFATTALAFLRVCLGEDLTPAIADARRALTEPLPDSWLSAEQFSFLGTGWTVGLAHEAALKMREAAGAWTESYPAMEYRHGPISIAGPGRVTWSLGPAPDGLRADVERTGAEFVESSLDPLADLIRVQRLAVGIAERRGTDPDNPRNLTRSVVLEDA